MSILSDPLNRKWLDISSANPHLVNQYKSTIVSFLGFDHQKIPNIVGSGFILGAGQDEQLGQYAFVLTAKHVLDGVRDFQGPSQMHAPSALSEFIVQNKLSLEPSKLKVLWMNQQYSSMMNVVYTFYSEKLDIACCIVIAQETDNFIPASIPFDCRTPSVGDTVHMVSCAGLEVSETVAPQKQDGSGQILKIGRSVSIRIGTVTEVHGAGLRHYKFPCFTTSIPAEPGMSGGFVTIPEDGCTVAACGVVSGDFSTIEARNNMTLSGESVIASTWPALGLSIVESISNEGTQKMKIYDMIKADRMPVYGNSMDQFEVINLQGDDCRVHRKT